MVNLPRQLPLFPFMANCIPARTYKVISLWQPWAQMVAWGLKQYETRGWTTHYRGTLLIHAAKHWTYLETAACTLSPFKEAICEHLGAGAFQMLPRGCIVASVELVDVVAADSLRLTDDERAVGDFGPGRWAWKLENVKPIVPIAMRGQQGLFQWSGVVEYG